MLMTQQDLKNLISQVNEAFKGQFNRLSNLEEKVARLEENLNEQGKRSTPSKSRGKRVQQTEENA
jgi:tRNA(Phe) wybutosine-synthesizing methylase Tyw3